MMQARKFKSVSFHGKRFAKQDVPIVLSVFFQRRVGQEGGGCVEQPVRQASFVELGLEDTEIVEVLVPGAEQLVQADVVGIDEQDLQLPEYAERARAIFPSGWEVVGLEMGDFIFDIKVIGGARELANQDE